MHVFFFHFFVVTHVIIIPFYIAYRLTEGISCLGLCYLEFFSKGTHTKKYQQAISPLLLMINFSFNSFCHIRPNFFSSSFSLGWTFSFSFILKQVSIEFFQLLKMWFNLFFTMFSRFHWIRSNFFITVMTIFYFTNNRISFESNKKKTVISIHLLHRFPVP